METLVLVGLIVFLSCPVWLTIAEYVRSRILRKRLLKRVFETVKTLPEEEQSEFRKVYYSYALNDNLDGFFLWLQEGLNP